MKPGIYSTYLLLIRKAVIFFLLIIPVFCYAQPLGSDSSLVIHSLVFKGNKITHENIMRREMEFKQGDTVTTLELQSKISQSKLNLLNTSLFNFVTIETDTACVTRAIDVRITVIERWYTWIGVIAELADRNLNTWWETRDFTRVNIGLRLSRNNFRGRMEQLRFAFQVGPSQKFSMYYEMPYINRRKTMGLVFNAGFSRQHEVGYITKNDKFIYLNSANFLRQDLALSASIRIRRNMIHSHQFGLQYNKYNFTDSLLILNPSYSFGNNKQFGYFSFVYQFKADHRDIHYYPLKGWYFDIIANETGFGMLPGHAGSIWNLNPTFRYYQPLSVRFNVSGSVAAKVSSKAAQPYFYQRGLGYGRDFVRGYEYYVIDGKQYILIKTNIKFALLQPRTMQIGFIPSEKFSKLHYSVYLNIFADAGYVSGIEQNENYHNLLPDSMLGGIGAGIDVVTYYDKVMRLEYTINRWGESGIFIHFIAGI
ncbi:MAG: POTRA domain-containing protein [Bacteroidales bacterium]